MILTALIRAAFPSATFCSVAVFTDLKAEPHIDSNNDERFMNRLLSAFQGGSVWVESDQGDVERSYRGRKRRGVLLDVASGPVSLDSSALHATEPWVGSRVVLVAYCPRNMHKLCNGSLGLLCLLGFRPPDPPCGQNLAPQQCPGQTPKFPPHPPVIPTVVPQTGTCPAQHQPQGGANSSGPRARPAARPYALEVFCGSGGLSVALRRWSIDTLGVDHFTPRTGARSPMVKLDLRKPEHQRILWREIRQADVIWLAPPCGTASKHTRLTRPAPVCEKVDTPTVSCRCQTHHMGTAKDDLLSSPLVNTCMRCHKVTSLGPTGPFSAALRRPGQSGAGATLGSPGTECGMAEGFASPFWKPPGANRQGGRGPLELVGGYVHFCSPACYPDGSALKRVTIRPQAICADQWLGVGTLNAQSQVKFFSLCHGMLWVRLGVLQPGRRTFRLVQQVLYWPAAHGVPDRRQQTVHSAQAAASFSLLGAAGELSRSELRCLCNCTSSLCRKRTPTCRIRSSRCSVQDSIARVVLVTGSPVLLDRGFVIAGQTRASPLGRMDLIEQYQSEADEPATPPTPTRPSSMATVHDPEWTLDLVAQTDEGTLCRALKAAGADFADLEVLGRRLLEEACVDEADYEHLRWRLGIIGDRPSPLEIVLHFAIFLDGPQLQVWYLRLLDDLQSAAVKRDFPEPCWGIIVPAYFCRTALLRSHVIETEPPGHVRHRTGLHVPGTRSLQRCFSIPVDTTRSDQTAATRMLELGDCLDPSLCFHLVHTCSPLDGVVCLLHCNGPWQRRDGARLLLSLPTGGLSLAADSKGGLNCLRHAPIVRPTTTSLNTLVNASAFPVGLVYSSPPARGRISVERRGHGHMNDAAGRSFCRALLSEWGSRMPTADTTTGGSCAGAWTPGALYLVTFHRVQCLTVPQVPGLKPDLPTKPKRPVCRVGSQQCQHPTWSRLHQAVLCGGRLCASCVTRVAPTETAQLRTTHGTIDHSSTPGRCGKATPGHWTKSANKATAKLQAGGACHSCRGDSRCITHYPRRMRRLDFRANIMWTARCLWRPALSTSAFSRGYLWVYGLSIMRWNPGRPWSAETAHLKSGTAACQSSTQAGSTAVDWLPTHPRGRKMHTRNNEVAEGFSSSGTCSGTSSGPESGAWWARGNTPEAGKTTRRSYSHETVCAAQRCAPSQRWSQSVCESRMGSTPDSALSRCVAPEPAFRTNVLQSCHYRDWRPYRAPADGSART